MERLVSEQVARFAAMAGVDDIRHGSRAVLNGPGGDYLEDYAEIPHVCIARAMNSHDALVAALQRYVDCDMTPKHAGLDTPYHQAKAALAMARQG